MPRPRRGAEDPLGTLPLFDPGPRWGRTAERSRTQRPAGHGPCPCCLGEKIAVIRAGQHLLWREHTYRTYSGAPITCAASLAGLCNAPPRSGDLRCPHP